MFYGSSWGHVIGTPTGLWWWGSCILCDVIKVRQLVNNGPHKSPVSLYPSRHRGVSFVWQLLRAKR